MRRGQVSATRVRERRRQRTRRGTATQGRSTPVRQSSTRAPVQRPHARLAWYTGLALMAVLEVIEWPLAIVMVLGRLRPREAAGRGRDRARHTVPRVPEVAASAAGD